ncbi:MAG: aspartate dehydrogenase [Clostridia bacterium]|nr:aspartate dehydrogenase [Clostridia bacterium]MBR0206700.1 aspartate dehydrogenase [Clostridia bacterium]
MLSWLKRKKAPAEAYDAKAWEPVIRSSICTGEKVAGFREKETGRFREVCLIRTPDDLDAFRRRYGVEGDIPTIY